MPVIFESTHFCDGCKRKFDWIYFELKKQRNGLKLYEVETFPENKKLVHTFKETDIGTYYIEVNCPICDYDNHFPFILEK